MSTKKLIIGIIVAVGAMLYLYTHQDLWRRQAERPVRVPGKGPVAIKLVSASAYKAPQDFEIALIDGDRWRVEAKSHESDHINVGVSDGTKTASNLPASAATLDPRPFINYFLAAADAYTAMVQAGKAPTATEFGDKRQCWKTGMTFQGMDCQFWVDAKDHYPVCVTATGKQKYLECHFVPLDIDVTKPGTDYFNPTNTTPLFQDQLKP